MNLRSLAAGFILAMLLLASLGGMVCEADCVSADSGAHGSHACCPAQSSAGDTKTTIGNSALCGHPRRELASVDVAPVFAVPVAHIVAVLAPVHFTVASASRAIPATASPPIFPLRI